MVNLPNLLNRLFHPRFSVVAMALLIFSAVMGIVLFPKGQEKDIEEFVPAVEKITSVMVLPHHDLVLGEFSRFYASIVSDQRITKIILLSPNHFQPEATMAKTTDQAFVLADDKRLAVVKNVSNIFSRNVVVDVSAFDIEHGVLLHVPFIYNYFPEAEVVPLLLTRNIQQADLNQIIDTVKAISDEQTLVLVSTDFSHNLPYEAAQKRDSETLILITARRDDEILKLNDEYLDCPACLYVVMNLQPFELSEPEVLYHGNSAQYLSQTANDPTTSYFVLRW